MITLSQPETDDHPDVQQSRSSQSAVHEDKSPEQRTALYFITYLRESLIVRQTVNDYRISVMVK